MHYLDVRESMRNGGSSACLRQRAMPATDALPAPVWCIYSIDVPHMASRQ
jgi:succinylarginine dihydrolase